MKLTNLKYGILGLTLALVASLAPGEMSRAHAANTPQIWASWQAGVLTVNGSGFTVNGTIDVYAYDRTSTQGNVTFPARLAMTVGTPCAIYLFCFGATVHASIDTLNPPACNPVGFQGSGIYDVIAVDETTQAVSNLATVYAPCGSGLGKSGTAPQSTWISGTRSGGVVSASGPWFTPGGGVDFTLYRAGQIFSTAHTTATIPQCGVGSGIWCNNGYASATLYSGPDCDGYGYTLVALDEATHHLSNEVNLTLTC